MSATSKTLFERIIEFKNKVIVPVGVETLRLLPDGVVLGTALFAFLGMCQSYGVLLFTMFELMFSQRIFAMIISGIAPMGAGENALKEICQPGFSFPNTMRISLLETIGTPSAFPSPVMFFLTGIISYMLGCINQFGREIKLFGGDIGVRTTIAVILSSLFVFAMFAFRYTYGCESFGSLLLSLILGLIAGILIVFQNLALFGRQGINILNIPIIQTIGSGTPMFVCAPTDT